MRTMDYWINEVSEQWIIGLMNRHDISVVGSMKYQYNGLLNYKTCGSMPIELIELSEQRLWNKIIARTMSNRINEC